VKVNRRPASIVAMVMSKEFRVSPGPAVRFAMEPPAKRNTSQPRTEVPTSASISPSANLEIDSFPSISDPSPPATNLG